MQQAAETSRPDWSRIRRVLLVRLRSIGDTVLMTPCLEALKSWRPELEVTVLMEPLSAPILEAHPLIDQLIVAEKSFAARDLTSPSTCTAARRRRCLRGLQARATGQAIKVIAPRGCSHSARPTPM